MKERIIYVVLAALTAAQIWQFVLLKNNQIKLPTEFVATPLYEDSTHTVYKLYDKYTFVGNLIINH